MSYRDHPSDGGPSINAEFHPESGSFRTEFDVTSYRPSEAVIAAVAEATDQDPLELPSLFSEIDPDGLDAVFATEPEGASNRNGLITFTYADCNVTVNSLGKVEVDPPIVTETAEGN